MASQLFGGVPNESADQVNEPKRNDGCEDRDRRVSEKGKEEIHCLPDGRRTRPPRSEPARESPDCDRNRSSDKPSTHYEVERREDDDEKDETGVRDEKGRQEVAHDTAQPQ